MKRNIVPLAALVLAATQGGRTGTDHERSIADGRRLYGYRRRLPAGRRGGFIPAEREYFFVLSPRSPVPHPSIRNTVNQ